MKNSPSKICEWDPTNQPYQDLPSKSRSRYQILRFFRGPETVGPVGDFLDIYFLNNPASMIGYSPVAGNTRDPILDANDSFMKRRSRSLLGCFRVGQQSIMPSGMIQFKYDDIICTLAICKRDITSVFPQATYYGSAPKSSTKYDCQLPIPRNCGEMIKCSSIRKA